MRCAASEGEIGGGGGGDDRVACNHATKEGL